MKATKFLSFALALLVSGSAANCRREPQPAQRSSEADAVALEQSLPEGRGGQSLREPSASLTSAATNVESKLIRTAKVRLQVKNTQKATTAVTHLVSKHKGYIASQSITSGSYSVQSDFLIRVPSDSFDNLLNELLVEASFVESKVIELKDVTEEFVDLTARLKTQQEVESRYREILKQARKIEEILAVEKQLGEIRQEIEARQGRLQFLSHQVNYGTIHLTFSERLPYQRPPQASFLASMVESFKDGWSDFLGFLLKLVSTWPFLIGIALSVAVFRRWRRVRRKKLPVQASA
jgi:hypothetical protein